MLLRPGAWSSALAGPGVAPAAAAPLLVPGPREQAPPSLVDGRRQSALVPLPQNLCNIPALFQLLIT